MKNEKKIRLVVANKQKTRQVQRYIIAGSVFSVFGFFCALMYWNLGVNSDAKAGVAYSWNGSSDSLWTNASNWTPNGVPSSADDITIPSTPRIPVLNDHVTVNGLNLSTNAQIDFNGFDVTYYFISALQKYGTNFLEKIPEYKHQGLSTNFEFYK